MTRPQKNPGVSGIPAPDLLLSRWTPWPLGQRGGLMAAEGPSTRQRIYQGQMWSENLTYCYTKIYAAHINLYPSLLMCSDTEQTSPHEVCHQGFLQVLWFSPLLHWVMVQPMKLSSNKCDLNSNLIAELSLRAKWHTTLHVISALCVAPNLHTIALGPFQSTCWRRFAVKRL